MHQLLTHIKKINSIYTALIQTPAVNLTNISAVYNYFWQTFNSRFFTGTENLLSWRQTSGYPDGFIYQQHLSRAEDSGEKN